MDQSTLLIKWIKEGSALSNILIIDDDTALTEMLKTILEPRLFLVHSAHRVEDALQAVKLFNPDVIVVDLYLQESNGWKICRSIRQISQAPILVLSVLNKPESVAQALDEGADDYLIKPVSSGVLVAHINNLLRRSRTLRTGSDLMAKTL